MKKQAEKAFMSRAKDRGKLVQRQDDAIINLAKDRGNLLNIKNMEEMFVECVKGQAAPILKLHTKDRVVQMNYAKNRVIQQLLWDIKASKDSRPSEEDPGPTYGLQT